MDRAVDQFGANLRAARKAKGWTQEDLAHESGLAPVQISRIERGVREIRLTTLVRLLAALDVSPGQLLDAKVLQR
jgi:HTH-type transcriptional regulator/antitoxin HipB